MKSGEVLSTDGVGQKLWLCHSELLKVAQSRRKSVWLLSQSHFQKISDLEISAVRQFGDSICAERSTLRKFPHRQFRAQHSALSDRPPSKHSNAMSHMCLHIHHYYRHLHSLETFIMDNASHFPLPTFSSFSTANSLNLSTFNV